MKFSRLSTTIVFAMMAYFLMGLFQIVTAQVTTRSGKTTISDASLVYETNSQGGRVALIRFHDRSCTTGYYDSVLVDGAIEHGEPWVRNVESFIRTATPCKTNDRIVVYLSSNGGSAGSGAMLGYVFRHHQVHTRVPNGGVCFSACADAFLGGEARSMGESAILMYHPSYKTNPDKTTTCSPRGGDIYNYFHNYYLSILPAHTANLLINEGWDCAKDTFYNKPMAMARSLLTHSF